MQHGSYFFFVAFVVNPCITPLITWRIFDSKYFHVTVPQLVVNKVIDRD